MIDPPPEELAGERQLLFVLLHHLEEVALQLLLMLPSTVGVEVALQLLPILLVMVGVEAALQLLPILLVMGGVGAAMTMTIRARAECPVASLVEITTLIGHQRVELVSHAPISLSREKFWGYLKLMNLKPPSILSNKITRYSVSLVVSPSLGAGD